MNLRLEKDMLNKIENKFPFLMEEEKLSGFNLSISIKIEAKKFWVLVQILPYTSRNL